MGNNKWSSWIQIITSVGTLASVIFFMMQAYYAKSAIVRSSEWEKARMTIENVERYKEGMNKSPLSNSIVWVLGDEMWPDVSTSEGFQLTDTLQKIFFTLYSSETDAMDEIIRLIEIMDAFAYPIIMGYASEEVSFQSGMRQFYTYGNFIMPFAFHNTPLLGVHAKLLYRLWRIRTEIISLDKCIANGWTLEKAAKNKFMSGPQLLLGYEESDFSEASIKKHRKKMEVKLEEMQKEIEDYRKKSLR